MMIIPIGGADMPTVISLLNSYAGFSAAAMGSSSTQIADRSPAHLTERSGFQPFHEHVEGDESFISNVLFGAFGQDRRVPSRGADRGKARVGATAESFRNGHSQKRSRPGSLCCGLRHSHSSDDDFR